MEVAGELDKGKRGKKGPSVCVCVCVTQSINAQLQSQCSHGGCSYSDERRGKRLTFGPLNVLAHLHKCRLTGGEKSVQDINPSTLTAEHIERWKEKRYSSLANFGGFHILSQERSRIRWEKVVHMGTNFPFPFSFPVS